MMQARTLVDKRVGYLACSLVLHPDHSFVLLIIGSIQRDLKSEIYLEVTYYDAIYTRLTQLIMCGCHANSHVWVYNWHAK